MHLTRYLFVTHRENAIICPSATSSELEKLVVRAAERNRWITALSILDGAIKLDMIPTWRAYKSAIDSVASHTNWMTSIAVVDKLRGGRLSTQALFRTLLAASITSNSTDVDCFHILCAMGDRRVSVTSKECALVAKKLEVNRFNDALLKMPSFLGNHGIPLTCEIASSVLGACADNDGLLWREASLLYSATCIATNGNPSEASTHAFIRSLDGSHWKLGLECFVAASHSVRQRPRVISATASLLQRCGRWMDAFKIIGSLHAIENGYWDDDMDVLVDRHSMEIPWIKGIQLLDRRPHKSLVSNAAVALAMPKDQWEICTRMIESSILAPHDSEVSPHAQRHNAMIILHACRRLLSISPWYTALRCIEVTTASNLLPHQSGAEVVAELLRVQPMTVAVLEAAIVMKVPRTKEFLYQISKNKLLRRLAAFDGFWELSNALSKVGMWKESIKVSLKAVEGQYEDTDKCRVLAEEVMVRNGLWMTALYYASICPLEEGNTLRTFSIPLCAVNGRWDVVHKALTQLRNQLTDVESLLLKESHRNLTEHNITSAIKRDSLAAAYDYCVSYYGEVDSMTQLPNRDPLPLGVPILNQLCEMAFHGCEMIKTKQLAMMIQIGQSSEVSLFVREVLCNNPNEDAKLGESVYLMKGLFTSVGIPIRTSLAPLLNISGRMKKFLGSPQALLSICRRILSHSEMRIDDVEVLKYALNSSQAYMCRPFPDFVCDQIERAILKSLKCNNISWVEALSLSSQKKLRAFSESLVVHAECIVPLSFSIPVFQWRLAIHLLQSSKEETYDTVRCARDIFQAAGNLFNALPLAEKVAFLSKEDADAYVNICRAKAVDVEELKVGNGVKYGSWVSALRAISSLPTNSSTLERRYYGVMRDLMRETTSKSWAISLSLFCKLHKDSFKTPTGIITITSEDVFDLLDGIINAGRLLQAGKLLELVISPSFQSRHKIVMREELFTKLIYACVPLKGSNTIPRSDIQQTLEIMRRVAKKSNELRLMSSLVQLLQLEQLDENLEPEKSVDGMAVDCTFPEASNFDAPRQHQWTNDEKAIVASYFPILKNEAPKEWFSTKHVHPSDSRMSVFVDVAATSFKGRLSGIDVHSLWYRNKGGSMRHLERLFNSKKPLKLLSGAQMSEISESTNNSLPAPLGPKELASKLPLIKYGTAQYENIFIGDSRPASIIKSEAFKSWAAIRRSVAKELVAAADATVDKMDEDERLLITFSDYAHRNIEDPLTLAEISLNVFNGTVGAKAVQAYLKRNWDKILAFGIERWPRAAEEEIVTSLEETNQVCTALRSLPDKTTQEIHHYAHKFQCVIFNRNSFSSTDLETIAVSSKPTTLTDNLISLHSKASILQTVYKNWRRVADLRCSSLHRDGAACNTNTAATRCEHPRVSVLATSVRDVSLRGSYLEKETISERNVMERAVHYQFKERGFLQAHQCVSVIKIYGSDWVSAFKIIKSSGSLTWEEAMRASILKRNVDSPMLFHNFQHLPLLRGYAVLCSGKDVDPSLSASIRTEIERLISNSSSSAADAKLFWIQMVSSGITKHMQKDDVNAISLCFAAHCP